MKQRFKDALILSVREFEEQPRCLKVSTNAETNQIIPGLKEYLKHIMTKISIDDLQYYQQIFNDCAPTTAVAF
ncbi:MAG: hypothetical protein EZS28_000818 [Streblomastix strix]|uniref:Uncharacterized protein n=1 Tax=Streblomastix strix TaxID=222440 RepID=A0A5J4X929_9EUKA|nr:MAG: hypothetical protein EZS28_000818 [Streblomastix strix]